MTNAPSLSYPAVARPSLPSTQPTARHSDGPTPLPPPLDSDDDSTDYYDGDDGDVIDNGNNYDGDDGLAWDDGIDLLPPSPPPTPTRDDDNGDDDGDEDATEDPMEVLLEDIPDALESNRDEGMEYDAALDPIDQI